MDDPGWSWPAWKFGLKRDDLFTTLHDRYNTFTSPIQDPEAFHHDVYEISRDADSAEEFHRLMADRQRQRIQELSESLESLAVEIIANPKLMDSEHWQYALQLFRTRSFDSIVRYFASYLPDDNLDHHDSHSTSSSFSDAHSVHTTSTKASSVDDAPCPTFLDHDFFPDGPVMTDEPCSIEPDDCSAPAAEALPSPPQTESVLSESVASSPAAIDSHGYSPTDPPSRSMSFSGSESGPYGPDFARRSSVHDDDEFSSRSDDCDVVVTSISDCAESPSSLDSVDTVDKDLPLTPVDGEMDDDEFLPAQYPEDAYDPFDNLIDTLDSDTPTPKQETIASCYVEYKSVVSRRLPSPKRRSPSPRGGRRDESPLRTTRRSPEEALSKIQKSPQDPLLRRRPKGKRWLA